MKWESFQDLEHNAFPHIIEVSIDLGDHSIVAIILVNLSDRGIQFQYLFKAMFKLNHAC